MGMLAASVAAASMSSLGELGTCASCSGELVPLSIAGLLGMGRE
jgi:hypothetical protein